MDRPRILVIGSINMDLMVELERMPLAGETVMGENYRYVPGGKGANQAVAALRQGADVQFAARVGCDANGRVLREGLQAEGMGLDYFREDAHAPTGLAVIPVDSSGQNRIIVLAGANGRLSADDAREAVEGGCDCVMLQFEIEEETVKAACQAAAARGIPVVVDAGPARSFPLEEIHGVTILTPNETEAEALVGFPVEDEASARQACQKLMERSGARYIVLKLGGRGAMLYDGKRMQRYPAIPDIRVVDTTAAGDSFTAAMTAEWLRSGDMDRAMRYGNAAGGLAVTRKGAQPSLPTLAETEALLAKA